jgi:hypothetical protein
MTNLNGPQQPRGKKKGKGKKVSGNNNSNANVGGAKKENKQVNFSCKLCKVDHLTHQFPKMEEVNVC